MSDDAVRECPEGRTRRIKSEAAAPKIQSEVLLDVLPVHVNDGTAAGKTPRGDLNVLEDASIQVRWPISLFHEGFAVDRGRARGPIDGYRRNFAGRAVLSPR